MKTAILFFAAGLGTRMGDLTQDQPKPLIRVGGRALIDHALDLAQEVGPHVVNLHYKAGMLRTHLAGRNIIFSDETDLLRETGGGLRHAIPLLHSDPVMTMNTDAVWRGPNPISQLLTNWRNEMEALLLLVPKAQVTGHKGKGDFAIGDAGHLTRAPEYIYTGLQMIRKSALDNIDEDVFSLNVVWDQIIARRGLYGVRYEGQWCDVGQPQSIPLAEAMLNV